MNKRILFSCMALGALVLSGFGGTPQVSEAESKAYSVTIPAFGDNYTQDTYTVNSYKNIRAYLNNAADNDGDGHAVNMRVVKSSDLAAPTGAAWTTLGHGEIKTLWDNNTTSSLNVKVAMDTGVFEYVTANGTMYWN